MKKNHSRSLTFRLALWFTALSFLPLTLLGVLIYFQRAEVNKSQIRQRLEVVRDLKVNEIKVWFQEKNNDVMNLAGDAEICRATEGIFSSTEATSSTASDSAHALRLLERYVKSYLDLDRLYIANARTGLVALTTDASLLGVNVGGGAAYEQALKLRKVGVSSINHSARNAQVITFTAPIICMTQGEPQCGRSAAG